MGFCPYKKDKKCEILDNSLSLLERFRCSLSCKLYQYEIQKRKKNGTLKHQDSHSDYHDDNQEMFDLSHHIDNRTNSHTDYAY